MPRTALSHLDALDAAVLDEKQQQKYAHRKATALYKLARYDSCLNYINGITSDESIPEELQDLRCRALQRQKEAKSGICDWHGVFTVLEKGQKAELADYQGPVSVANVGEKGQGLVALREVSPGELLLVANPVAVAGLDDNVRSNILGLNLASKNLDPGSAMQAIALMYDSLRDQPALVEKLHNLFAGPQYTRSSLTARQSSDSPAPSIDAGRIEGILTYNSFRPQCLTTPLGSFSDIATTEDDLDSATSLYHLPSMVNHSCIGNASYVFFGEVLVLHATRKMLAGEEVLFS